MYIHQRVLQVIDALLNVLVSRSEGSVQIYWETGWFFHKMLALQMIHLNDGAIILFKVRISMIIFRLLPLSGDFLLWQEVERFTILILPKILRIRL